MSGSSPPSANASAHSLDLPLAAMSLSAAPQPSLPHLHRDALESILAFLSINELAVATVVSREWRAATLSMAPIGIQFTLDDVVSFCASRLYCVHASGLIVVSDASRADLELLSTWAPHLASLECSLNAPPSCDAGLCLPPKLIQLVVRCCDAAPDLSHPPPCFPLRMNPDESLDEARLAHDRANHITAAVSASSLPVASAASAEAACLCHLGLSQQVVMAAASHHTLESLELKINPSDLPKLNFACLSMLRTLQGLRIEFTRSTSRQLSASQIDAIRELHWLSSVSIQAITGKTLRQLLRTPHNLQWICIEQLLDVVIATGECIATLPLFFLDCSYTQPVSWLPRLGSSLRNLSLSFGLGMDHAGLVQAEELCTPLCSLAHLTTLSLGFCPLTAEHLSLILPSMPELRKLSLTHIYFLESLSFLEAPGVPMLHSLWLYAPDNNELNADSGQLLHVVRSQKQLQDLRVKRTWDLTTLELFMFEVPSLHMPQLQQFHYEPLTMQIADEGEDEQDDGEDANEVD